MLPNLAIVLLTYKRTDLAVRTVVSTAKNLIYPRGTISWYIADDGSPREHMDKIMLSLVDNGQTLFGSHNERLRPAGMDESYFSGKSWNRGLGIAHQWTDFVLTLEDDWELTHPLDISRYVEAMQNNENIGMIRLGTLAGGNWVKIVGYDGVHYLQYSKNEPYAYSGNPNIRHARFTRAYGYYAEDKNPGDIELDFDWRFRTTEGPDIIRPAEINPWGAWGHIGTDKSYA